MLRTGLVRRAGRLLGAVAVAGVLIVGSAGASQAASSGANGIKTGQSSIQFSSHAADWANGI
jgi:hypothetical protein